jgi:hypothetical protein
MNVREKGGWRGRRKERKEGEGRGGVLSRFFLAQVIKVILWLLFLLWENVLACRGATSNTPPLLKKPHTQNKYV